MSKPSLSHEPLPTRVIAEASVWVARVYSPHRPQPSTEGLQRWLKQNPSHRQAFDLAESAFIEARNNVRRAGDSAFGLSSPVRQREKDRGLWKTASILAVFAAVFVMGILANDRYALPSEYRTGIGERLAVKLLDGTRIDLNESSRLSVDYTRERRSVHLKFGEAQFDVAKNKQRPFLVHAGDYVGVALGTKFVVKAGGGIQVSMTLLEGKLAMRPEEKRWYQPSSDAAAEKMKILSPGDRLTHRPQQAQLVRDQPDCLQLTLWAGDMVRISDRRLDDAVAELNLYSDMKLLIVEPEAKNLVISGIFRKGDMRDFADTMARLYGLKPDVEGSTIKLYGIPQPRA
jgi:transmembrane sensor